jgi:hypothetical protein
LLDRPTDKWNVHELFHASMILVTFHGLCGLIFGQGLKEEVRSFYFGIPILQIDLPLSFDI